MADAQQRPHHPGTNHPLAHGSLGLVDHPQQRMLLVAGHHGAGQLQIAPGADVQVHKPLAVVELHFRRGLDLVFLLRILQISDHRAQGTHRLTAVTQVQCGDLILLQGLYNFLGAGVKIKQRRLRILGGRLQPSSHELHHMAIISSGAAKNHLSGRIGGQLIDHLALHILAGSQGHMKLAG